MNIALLLLLYTYFVINFTLYELFVHNGSLAIRAEANH